MVLAMFLEYTKDYKLELKKLNPEHRLCIVKAHSLILVTQDSMQNIEKARDILHFIRELITFIK
jgi:hypothetical protein